MDSKFIVRFSKIKNNRLLNRTQMVIKGKIYLGC